MTDLYALVARMADELDHYRQLLMDDRRETHALAVEARAALAELQPADDGEVAELVTVLEPGFRIVVPLLERLSDGPAVPDGREPVSVAEQPSDEELLAVLRHLYANQTAADMGAKDDLRTARAVLARWGTPNLAETRSSLEPIPVSARLPEEGHIR